MALLRQEKFAEAEASLRESLEICEATLPANHWMRARVRSRLGASLVGQERLADAEPHILAGCRGMPHEAEMLQHAVQLYEAWGKSADAAAWRSKLAELQPASP